MIQHWKNTSGDGLFSTNANWTPGPAPGSADTAFIDLAGTYTVTSSSAVTISQLAIIATATLDVTSGSTFTVNAGTATGGIAGRFLVENGSRLNLGGTVADTGVIQLNGGANNTDLVVNGATTTLQGGGKLVLAGSGNARVYGASRSDVLVNVNNTISGAGSLGANQLTFQNQAFGTVNANLTTALNLATGSNTIINAGLLEDTGTGGLSINSTVDQRSGSGRILASGAGATATIGATIIGGTLSSQNGGVIDASTNDQGLLDGQGTHSVTNAATIVIANGVNFYLAGTINNTGTISLDATTSNANLIGDSGFTTLIGGGQVVLSNDANNRIYAAQGNWTLDNVNNTISGAGQLGANQMYFVNSGTVDANQSLQLQLYFNNIAVNTGLIEATDTATGNGGLQLFNSTLDNAGGSLLASGANAHVDLSNSVVIGGTLQTLGGGVIQTTVGTSGLDGQTDGAVLNQGTVRVNDNTTLNIAGILDNAGTLFVDGTTSSNTNLVVNGNTVSLQGAGHVSLSDDANNRVYGNSLVNVNDTIAGAGQLGANDLSFTNEAAGVVDATGVNALQLYFNTTATNLGLLEATSTAANNGGLLIYNSTIDNSGGTILATGTNAHVDLSGAYIEGGTLNGAGAGIIRVTSTATLDGLTAGQITNAGTLQVNDGTSLDLIGTINNTFKLLQNAVSASATTYIHLGTPVVTLTGGGQWVMSDSDNNVIYGGNQTLVNVNNTIRGAGDFGDNQLKLVNEAGGVIDATQAASTVAHQSGALDLYTGNTTQNSGILEATNTGGLYINGGAVNNAGGTIQAVGSGANVDLINNTTIEGGTLSTSGTGAVVQVLTGYTASLDGITQGTVTNTGSFKVDDNSTLALAGTITNKGTISQDAVSASSTTYIHSDFGGGDADRRRRLGDVGQRQQPRLWRQSDAGDVNNAISGAGDLGDNQLVFIN